MRKMSKVLAALTAITLSTGLGYGYSNAFAADITIENPVKDTTYTAYKVLDAEIAGEAVSYYTNVEAFATALQNAKDGDKAMFTVTANADKTRWNVAMNDGISEAAVTTWFAANYKTATTNGILAKSTTVDSVTFTGLADGYYLITTGEGKAYTIETAGDNVTVIDKNTNNPTIDPNFKKVNGHDVDTAQIGDKVSFTINFTATNYAVNNKESKKIEKYFISDNPTGMKIDFANVAVKVGNKSLTEAAAENAVAGENFIKTAEGANGGFKIEIPWINAEGGSVFTDPSEVVVTYSAEITEENNTTTGQSVNAAKIQYLDVKNEDDVKVYTANLTVKKVKAGDHSVTLAGAEFRLYDANKIAINLIQNSDGTYRLPKSDENATETNFKVNDEGTVTIHGLDEDKTYFVQEVVAPAGFKLDSTMYQIGGEGENTLTWTQHTEETAGFAEKTIENTAGTSLPSTGGIGTTMFYFAGGTLVIGAAVLMVTRKRMKA